MSFVSHFAQPLWILAGLIALPVLLLLYWRFDVFQRRRARAFSLVRDSDSALYAVSRPLLWTKRAVFCLAVLAACVALAQPLGSLQLQESEQRGLDILFAMDTSRSMLTPDVRPDRLTRAKLAVEDLLDHLRGDGVGLVAFAGEAFLQAPVTNDYEAFRETLDSLDTHTIALGGTDIASAIRLGEATLEKRGDTQKVMVLITDGEDLGGDALLAAQAAAKQGMIIFTVGVGTAAGDLIPIPDGTGATQFVKDSDGKFVKSQLDSDMLTKIAAATGGVYTPLGPQGQGIVKLYQERLESFAHREHSDRQVAVYAQLFQWPVAVAIALLILEWLLGASVRRRVLLATPAKAAVITVLVLSLAPVATPRAWASPLSAQDEYNNGKYSQAQQDYAQSVKADPTQPQLQFNLGTAAYKAGDFAAALAAFNGALKTRDVPLQQSAYYNLGNTLFRQGEQGATKDPEGAMKTWQQAIGAYDTALQIKPADRDAQYNRGVVQMRLEALKRQQQQKQKQDQDKDKDKDKDKKDQDKNQKGKQDPNGHEEQQNQQKQQGKPDQQNAQNQPNQQGPQNQQPEQGQGKPQNQPDQHAPQPQPQQAAAAAAQDIGKPDEMSKLEAEQLLDSAKGEERHVNIGVRDGKPQNQPRTPLKDW
jgi:Ca-activated chloride channel family protein